MAMADKLNPQRATGTTANGISLSALCDHLGPQAAKEFFGRIDGAQRQGSTIIGTSVRDARTGLSKAKIEGHVQFVVPGRSGRVSPGDGLVIIKMNDLAAVVRAGRGEFDWTQTFAPRNGLEAATASPKLQLGSRGRRGLRA